MRCPYCGEPSTRVIDSRDNRDGLEVRRRRHCEECERRFTTRERLSVAAPKIIKRDERREEYERAKLERSIHKACVKRPVSENALERLVDRIERRLAESGEAEVSSESVGDMALEELCALDTLAASRFASVFRDFKNADDYIRFFDAAGKAARQSSAPEEPSE